MAKVTLLHLRRLEYCAPRIRQWCKDHGVKIRAFRDGIDADELRKTGCGMAIRAADLADREAAEAAREATAE